MSMCGKHCYPDKRAAVTACKALMKNGTPSPNRRKARRNHRPEYLRAYHCGKCKAWHLTHMRMEEYL